MPGANIDMLIAETFIAACPVGWSIGPDSELTRLDDLDGSPNWHLYNPSQGTDWNGGIAEAASFLLIDCGFGDREGIHDLVDRLRSGEMGGGT